jgi:hypothetical protein
MQEAKLREADREQPSREPETADADVMAQPQSFQPR